MLCPSSPVFSGNIHGISGVSVPAPGDSYFGSVGSSLEYDAAKTSGPPNGVFQFRGKAIGVRDVLDGTSNTIAFGEARMGDNNNSQITLPQDVGDVSAPPSGVKRNTQSMNMPYGAISGGANITSWLSTACLSALSSTATHESWVGDCWALGIFGRGLGNFVVPPNRKSPNCLGGFTTQTDFDDAPSVFAASSYHAGGVNIGMCDGSVRFLKDSVNMQALWSIGSRDQGEVVSADAY
jgi:prepilin-type processing-associated H-X9-DG protein